MHYAELHALTSSPNIIRNLKSRRLRWAGHVALTEQSRNAYRVNGRMILKWTSRTWVVILEIGELMLKVRTNSGLT